MKNYELRASVISTEIHLSQISAYFGINKKFKWEEPLVLNENHLKGILPHPEEKYVYIFHFGSIASVNLTLHELKDVVQYLKRIDKNLKDNISFNYVEDFKIIVEENAQFEVNYDSIVVDSLKGLYIDIVATILAKSVSLKKIEVDTDLLLDEIEKVMCFLDKGHLNLSDEQLAKMSGKILKFKYTSLSYLMVLDKPDIAWKVEAAEDFFVQLSDLFELRDRYDKIRHKTEVLLDITEVFAGLTHAKRGTRLEWAVIILILFEIIMSLAEKFWTYIIK
jgi:uncharacterized Rmd1/YagE family protein